MGRKQRDPFIETNGSTDAIEQITEKTIVKARQEFLNAVRAVCPECLSHLKDRILPLFQKSVWKEIPSNNLHWKTIRIYADPDFSTGQANLDEQDTASIELAKALHEWANQFNDENWILEVALQTLSRWDRKQKERNRLGFHLPDKALWSNQPFTFHLKPRDPARETGCQARDRLEKEFGKLLTLNLAAFDRVLEVAYGLKTNPRKLERMARVLALRQVKKLGPIQIQKEFDAVADKSLKLNESSNLGSIEHPVWLSEEQIKQDIEDLSKIITLNVIRLRNINPSNPPTA
jgi:hypothetical protein